MRSLRKKSKDIKEWLEGKIEQLVKVSDELVKISDVHYEGHSWTVAKLLLLMGWVYVYTTIIPKYCEEYWYIDLLAGSGTTKVKETGDVIASSPFIAYFCATEPFRRYIFVEREENKYRALFRRSSKIIGRDKIRVIQNNCNQVAINLSNEIKTRIRRGEKIHCLVFIDNEGLDTEWKAIEAMLEIYSDLIILFPTIGIRRTWGAAKKESSKEFSTLKRFFGGDIWRKALSNASNSRAQGQVGSSLGGRH